MSAGEDPKLSDLSAVSTREAAVLSWIHDFAPFGVITTDREFNIQSWNHWMEVHSGKSAAAVVGQNLFTLFPDLEQRNLLPRFVRALAGEVSVLSAGLHGYLLPLASPVHEGEFERMHQTARIAPLQAAGQTVGTIILIEDVTERESRALALRRQHSRDQVLSWASAHLLASDQPMRSIRELFFKIAAQFDFDAYLLYLPEANGGALQLHASGGISPDRKAVCDLEGSAGTATAVFIGVESPRALEGLAQARGDAAALYQRFGFRACALVPLQAHDTRLGVLCFGTRTRDRLQAGELELLSTIAQYLTVALAKEATRLELRGAQSKLNEHAQHLERQVNERTAKLRDTISEVEVFSYSLAHDLRGPIRALAGYCEVLTEDYGPVLPVDAQGVIRRLDSACRKLDGLTRDLLHLTRISRQDVQISAVSLEGIVAEVIALPSIAQECVYVRPPLHPVLGHKTLLRQCLANLVDNSLKFVEQGQRPKVTIWSELLTGETSPVASGSKGGGATVRITVADEGIGIAPEAHEKIFGIFERATSSPAYTGSGIGLAIVARAVHRMGGTCGVESQPGKGSRFWIELPAASGT